MEDLISITEKILSRHTPLKTGDLILAGVSGGPDSMALVGVLNFLRSRMGFTLAIAHIHHGLREDADLDAELVRLWCTENDLQLYEKRVDLKTEAALLSMSIEEAGRKIRQDYFSECRTQLMHCVQGNIYVALAHHRQDQAETLILNLSRGTGLSGLAGMKVCEGFYIRPFLSIDRTELASWLDRNSIPWRTDDTNYETVYMRNRIRHMLLPRWQETIGHDPVPTLVRASENIAMDDQCLEQIAEDVFCRVYNEKEGSLICRLLEQEHAAIQMRVLRKYFRLITGTVKDLSQKHLLLMQDVLLNDAGPYDLPYRFSIRSNHGQLILAKSKDVTTETRSEDWEINLVIPGITQLPYGFGSIEALKIEYKSDFRYNSEMNYFREAIPTDCVVRLRRTGDMIKPAGRQGTRLLKKFMNAEKIDPKCRDLLPVVASGNEIVWLPGYACGDAYVCSNADDGNSAIRLIWHRNG